MNTTWLEQEFTYWLRAFVGAVLSAAALAALQFIGAHIPALIQFITTAGGARVALGSH